MSRFTFGKRYIAIYRYSAVRRAGVPEVRPRYGIDNFLPTGIVFRFFPNWATAPSRSLTPPQESSPPQNRTRRKRGREKRKRALFRAMREHVTIRSHRGPRRDSIRWFPSPNSAAGALADPTLQSFPGNDCHYRAREGERERVDERSRGIGLHCDCVSVWSHWPTNCDYGRVCPSTDAAAIRAACKGGG